MNELEPALLNELRRNKFSGIPKFAEEDVANVWDSVSHFVQKQMACQKGVNIPGLGTFTFSQRSLEVGNGKHMVMQRPVFQLAEKFAQLHALNYTKHYVTGQTPILQLNFTAIATETPYSRETVESCIKEVLQALSRSLHVKRNVEFIFSGIGCLSIRDSRVKMKFYKEFIKSMDSTGELVNALRNRPDTTDSIFSDLITPRPATGNTVVLPRININPEDDKQGNNDTIYTCESNGAKICTGGNLDKNFHTMMTIEESNENERVSTPLLPPSPKCHHLPRPQTPAVRRVYVTPEPENPNEAPHRPVSASRGSRTRRLSLPSRNGSSSRSNNVSNKTEATKPVYTDLRITSPKPYREVEKKVKLTSPRPGTRCSHSNKAGQELCYLCHQRARKNIPVYLSEERKMKEYEKDRLLQQYQHDKDVGAILKEQTKNVANRKLNMETAAFNLGVAEAINEKKNEKPTNFNRSYLFRQRTLTPPYYLKQSEYSQELEKQISAKNIAFLKEKSDQDFMERLEQVQLAEDLAQQREQYLHEKKCKKDNYSEALNTQINSQHHVICRSFLNRSVLGEMTLPKPNVILPFEEILVSKLDRKLDRNKTVQLKPLPIPAAEPDSQGPIFGIHDATGEKMKEQRDRARKLYHEQLATVADKKREAILRDLTTQREESDMLERTKQELLRDRAEHYRDTLQARRALERSWADTRRRKQQRERDENLRVHSPGVLIQEQCDRYHRCDKCGRRPWNCGESNIWRESRYIAGSRLIV